MLLDRYLVVGRKPRQKPSARIVANTPALESHEIAIKLRLNIPDALFAKPALQAEIKVPEDAATAPVIDAEVISNIQEEISKNIGVDLAISLVEST